MCNLVFIPKYQAYGATIGTLAAQSTVVLVFTIYVRKDLPLWGYFVRNIPLFIIGSLMMVAIKITQCFHGISITGLLIDVIIGAFVYFVLFILFGMISKQHLAGVIMSTIRNRRS